jgi:hypothetical protein
MPPDLPDDALKQLSDCRTPYLIGVRHHSAALARVLPELLASFKPKAVLVEMPPEFQAWLPYLAKDDLETPVALAACDRTRLISFYPLADFSPELAAIRWATANKVPVIPCDLGLADMARLDRMHAAPAGDAEQSALKTLLHRFDARDSGELWEKLVETPASNSSPEAIRRAALYFGWMVRHSSNGPSVTDAHREAAMRAAVAAAPKRSVAVVGSFHAAALLPQPILWSPSEPVGQAFQPDTQASDVRLESLTYIATSLIPYSFAQLDQRSGYPAGVMDPVWQQTMLAAKDPALAHGLLADLAVELCRHLRHEGHVAGTPDATEIVRLARDLSRLRGQAAPGRGELLEAIETALVQGDLLGRGRAVAAAAQSVLVGNRRGRLPRGTPRSGLAVEVEAAIARLKLPGPEDADEEPRDLRLDPLRSRLDRGRAVLFRRLNFVGVHYAKRTDTEAIGNRENLTEAWQVQWTGATTARLEAAGMHGVTLMQASEAAVRRLRHSEAGPDDDQPDQQHPVTTLTRLSAAAECGLATTVRSLLVQLDGPFLRTASAANLIEAASVMQRIAAGHMAGLPLRDEDAAPPEVERFEVPRELLNTQLLLEAALRGFDGLRGSDEPADVVALVELTAMIRGDETSPLLPALKSHLDRLRRDGSPRMQGAGWGALAMLEPIAPDLHAAVAGWYDAASTTEGRGHLRSRLQGLMVPLLPLVSSDPDWLSGLEQRLSSSGDDEFLARLPALRGGFHLLTPADRARLLNDRLAVLQPGGPASIGARHIDDPESLARATAADRAGRAAVAALLPDLLLREPGKTDVHAKLIPVSEPPGEIPLADRWRLILGVKGCGSPRACRAARALDQLYGDSTRAGRGQRADLAGGGGTEAATPSAREWIDDVQELFDKDVCEEVLGAAVAGGRAAVLEHLDPNTARPSMELLQQVLALRGALPEKQLAHWRKLARRITERLAQQLANRLRPALSGLSTARPTRRRSRRLDFARTLDTNLDTAYRRDDGRVALAPRRLIFRTPARRHMDWHLIFVVDVSGSMEASVIYSALVAAIFAALPAIDVRFFAFSTAVIDLTDSVDDPLALLMEVQVGGGTHIGLGLRAAREAIKNPSRTLVVLVTDFEEGVSVPEVLAEVRVLADSGAKLLGLAALDDAAKPRYHTGNAAAVVAAGMPVAAVSPQRLAQWVGDQIRGGAS